MKKLEVGDSLTIQTKVTKDSAALNYGSGQLKEMFATPSLVALMIEASAQLIDETLEEGLISVGKEAKVIHEKPTVIGGVITVEVEVLKIDNDRIEIKMEAYDEIGKIGKGSNIRYIVNKKGLLERANERKRKLDNLDR